MSSRGTSAARNFLRVSEQTYDHGQPPERCPRQDRKLRQRVPKYSPQVESPDAYRRQRAVKGDRVILFEFPPQISDKEHDDDRTRRWFVIDQPGDVQTKRLRRVES